jgi:hypothetical protein
MANSIENAVSVYNGEYTIVNPNGEHRTFKIHTARKGGLAGKRIVSLMTGSDNESSYTGFAFLNNSSVKVWRKKQDKLTNCYATLLECIFATLENSDLEQVESAFDCFGRTYKVMLSKRCYRCNRKLTNPESIRLGVGPECATKI